MTVMAFVLEKIVIRSIHKEGDVGTGAADPTAITTKGADADLES